MRGDEKALANTGFLESQVLSLHTSLDPPLSRPPPPPSRPHCPIPRSLHGLCGALREAARPGWHLPHAFAPRGRKSPSWRRRATRRRPPHWQLFDRAATRGRQALRTWMHAVGSWGHAGVGCRRPQCAPAAEARPAAAAIGARRPRRHPRQPPPGPIRTIGVGGIGAPRPLPTCSGGREPVGRRVGGGGGARRAGTAGTAGTAGNAKNSSSGLLAHQWVPGPALRRQIRSPGAAAGWRTMGCRRPHRCSRCSRQRSGGWVGSCRRHLARTQRAAARTQKCSGGLQRACMHAWGGRRRRWEAGPRPGKDVAQVRPRIVGTR